MAAIAPSHLQFWTGSRWLLGAYTPEAWNPVTSHRDAACIMSSAVQWEMCMPVQDRRWRLCIDGEGSSDTSSPDCKLLWARGRTRHYQVPGLGAIAPYPVAEVDLAETP